MKDLHISDELLSSYIDQERDHDGVSSRVPDVEAHLASCEVCGARIAALRNAAALVATPVRPDPEEEKERAVAKAIRSGFAEQQPASRVRRPQILLGAAAAVVALAVALPLALLGRSSPTAEASRKAATHGAASTLGRSKAGTPAPFSQAALPPEGLSGTAAGSTSSTSVSSAQSLVLLPDLGAVSSIKQVVTRLDDALASNEAARQSSAAAGRTYSVNGAAQSVYASCVTTTRRSARGGAHGPGFVATATYQGRASIVTEFWPTVTAPPAGTSVVAVSTKDGCKLLARTTT